MQAYILNLKKSIFLLQIQFVEYFSQFFLICNQVSEFRQPSGIIRLGYPQLQIPSFCIFIGKMFSEAFILMLFIHLRIMRQTILYGTAQCYFRINNPVCLSHYFPVDTSRSLFIGGTMIFYRFFHLQHLIIGKPLTQSFIRQQYFARNDMMNFTSLA